MTWSRKPKSGLTPAGAARRLRDLALSTSPEEAGVAVEPYRDPVWACLMEIGFPDAVATLVGLADGSASLYFSTGAGLVGAGGHPRVREAASALVRAAEARRMYFVFATEYPQPGPGRVRFYLRTVDEVLAAEAGEEELRGPGHVLAGLFAAGHAVIAAMREAAQADG